MEPTGARSRRLSFIYITRSNYICKQSVLQEAVGLNMHEVAISQSKWNKHSSGIHWKGAIHLHAPQQTFEKLKKEAQRIRHSPIQRCSGKLNQT